MCTPAKYIYHHIYTPRARSYTPPYVYIYFNYIICTITLFDSHTEKIRGRPSAESGLVLRPRGENTHTLRHPVFFGQTAALATSSHDLLTEPACRVAVSIDNTVAEVKNVTSNDRVKDAAVFLLVLVLDDLVVADMVKQELAAAVRALAHVGQTRARWARVGLGGIQSSLA